MAKAKGASSIPISTLIEIIYNQTNQLVSSDSLSDLISSLPFDVQVDNSYVTLSSEGNAESEEEMSSIEGPAIDAAKKELK